MGARYSIPCVSCEPGRARNNERFSETDHAFFVEDGDDSHARIDESKGAAVVLVGNLLPLYPFSLVFLLHSLEDIQGEFLLQLLVGVIDTHLLEAVNLEALEAKSSGGYGTGASVRRKHVL